MKHSRLTNALLLAMVAIGAISCTDALDVEPGTIRMTVTTTGMDVDPDGYAVSVDGGPAVSLALNDTITLDDIRPGKHALRLLGRASNCAAIGSDSLSVNVHTGATANAAFTIWCAQMVGVIRVLTATTGGDPDPDGYSVSVDGGPFQLVYSTGTFYVNNLPVGVHSVVLGGVANNCAPATPGPQQVNVTYGGTTDLVLTVACTAVTGTLYVTTRTSGVELDPNGYTVSVDGGSQRPIGRSSALMVPSLSPGTHSVALTGVAANCTVAGPNPASATIAVGVTDTVAFDAICVSTGGALRVTTTTTGADVDVDGYALTIDADEYYNYSSWWIASNSVLMIEPLAAGTHTIELSGLDANCGASGPASVNVNVVAGDTAEVAFSVTCIALGSVQVTVTTNGSDPDPDGYEVVVERPGYQSAQAVSVNGTVTIAHLASGDYDVTVAGVATNCDVAAPDPRQVAVTAGSTTPVAIGISCIPATQLAFAGLASGSADIYTIKSNGTGSTRLTASGQDGDPAWSPDGAKIAFRSDRDGNVEIYVMNADGSNPVRLTNNTSADTRPAWSPDGSRIAFTSDRDGNAEIYVVNADGSGVVRLTNNIATDDAADWSPDGSKIAFTSNRGLSASGIYVMNADGGGVTRLSGPFVDYQPAWSPDGAKIAFSRLSGCYYNTCTSSISVMAADGSGVTPLTPSWSSADTDPTWSPDGQRIAYGTKVCDYYYGCYAPAITAVRINGTRAVTVVSGDVSNPAWRR